MNVDPRSDKGPSMSRRSDIRRLQFPLSTLLLVMACIAAWTETVMNSWQLFQIGAQIHRTAPLDRELFVIEPVPPLESSVHKQR